MIKCKCFETSTGAIKKSLNLQNRIKSTARKTNELTEHMKYKGWLNAWDKN